MENKKRFFAFGCSLTQYIWPTWADIVAHSFEQNGKEAYNFGVAGSGYLGVLYNIMKADEMYNFNDDDLIIIMWSSWNREDRLDNQTWSRWGNVLNSPVQEIFAPIWSLEFDIIKCITAYRAVNRMFNIDYNASIVNSEFNASTFSNDDHLLRKFHQSEMPNTWHAHLTETGSAWSDSALRYDGHPATPDHLKYVQDVVCPALPGLKIHPATVEWVKDFSAQGDAELTAICNKYKNLQQGEPKRWAIYDDMSEWADNNWKVGGELDDNESKLWFRDHSSMEDAVIDYLDNFMKSIKK